MRVYICGRVSGEEFTEFHKKFWLADIALRKRGYEVVNPVTLCSENDLTDWKECMQLCITELVKCDAVYLLPDWKESKGAKLEVHIAKKLNLKFVEL